MITADLAIGCFGAGHLALLRRHTEAVLTDDASPRVHALTDGASPRVHAFTDDALGDGDATETARRVERREISALEAIEAAIARSVPPRVRLPECPRCSRTTSLSAVCR